MKEINDIRLNPYFKLSEFQCPGSDLVMVDPDLIDGTYALRILVKCPVVITSGYRTPEHNKTVGGSPTSKHLEGKAVDVVMENNDISMIKLWCTSIGFDEMIFYPADNHWHLAVK